MSAPPRERNDAVAVDTSAVIALLEQEPPAAAIEEALREASARLLSAGTYAELGIVLAGRGSAVSTASVVEQLELTVVPVDDGMAELAVQAWQRYGRTKHPAALTFGNCFSYALAKMRHTPLVAIGNYFRQTDLAIIP